MQNPEVKTEHTKRADMPAYLPEQPEKRLLLALVVCAVFALIFFFANCGAAAYIPSLIIAAISIVGYIFEKLNNKRYKALTETRHLSAEWKERYKSYRLKNGFKSVDTDSMRKFLLKSRRGNEKIFTGVFVILLSALFAWQAVRIDTFMRALYIIFAVLFFAGGVWLLLSFSGIEVKEFYKETENIEQIEASFMKGKVLTYKRSGVNIGSEYLVVFSDVICAVKYEDIRSAAVNIVRTKNLTNGLYMGESIKFYAVFTVNDRSSGATEELRARLNEFQAEMAVEEVCGKIGQEKVQFVFTEDIDEDIVTPC